MVSDVRIDQKVNHAPLTGITFRQRVIAAILSFGGEEKGEFSSQTNQDSRSHSQIPLPDLIVKDILFEYSPWITTDEYQGKLKIIVMNSGQIPARNFYVFLHDSITIPINNPPDHESLKSIGTG